MLHNAWLTQGLCSSASLLAQVPGWEGIGSRYGLSRSSDNKEQAWEAVRLTVTSKLPSRKGAISLFEDESTATTAVKGWFPNETRALVEARIVKGSTVHVADARLLECHEQGWDANANKYWQGEMTASPLREVLVSGTVYFPR
jgi:hypothetical protein